MACMRMNVCAHAERERDDQYPINGAISAMVNIKGSLLLGL